MLNPEKALGRLPPDLRYELIEEYSKIVRNYREERWEAAELDGGRLSEIVYRILKGYLDGGTYPATNPKPFDKACDDLKNYPRSAPDSARLTVPRVLRALYELRNNRGVGHTTGEVSANRMDATFVMHTAQWVMAELVRLLHQLDVDDATAVVDALVERTVPVLWKVGGVTRVLRTGLSLGDQTVLLLYAEPRGLTDQQLALNLEQPKLGNYRRVLKVLHSARKIEYNPVTGLALISPLGVKEVETELLSD